MSASVQTVVQNDDARLKDKLTKHACKLMAMELPELKKKALSKGIPEEIIEAAATQDEDDTKGVLVRMMLKAACLGRPAPTPMRKRAPEPVEQDLSAQICQLCAGCIRPPGHEGPCMDGQCNDIIPEPEIIEDDSVQIVADEFAQQKATREKVERKLDEQAKQEAAAKEEARRKAKEEEAGKRAAAKAEAQRLAALEAQRKAAEEAQRKAAEEDFNRRVEEEAQRQFAEEQAQKVREVEEARQAAAQKAKEEEEARQWEAQQQQAAAMRKAAEEEAARQQAAALLLAEAEEEAAALRKSEAEEARRKDIEAQKMKLLEEEEEEMAQLCVETFLDCVNCSWRERPRAPLKGSNLYTRHIRPCRPAGTSIDVKDSAFRNLGTFLQFLEKEGLLRLKPGLTDPVVERINFDACRSYEYKPPVAPTTPAASPVKSVSVGFSGVSVSLKPGWQ